MNRYMLAAKMFLMLKNAGWNKSIETEKDFFIYDCDSLAFETRLKPSAEFGKSNCGHC